MLLSAVCQPPRRVCLWDLITPRRAGQGLWPARVAPTGPEAARGWLFLSQRWWKHRKVQHLPGSQCMTPTGCLDAARALPAPHGTLSSAVGTRDYGRIVSITTTSSLFRLLPLPRHPGHGCLLRLHAAFKAQLDLFILITCINIYTYYSIFMLKGNPPLSLSPWAPEFLGSKTVSLSPSALVQAPSTLPSTSVLTQFKATL